MKKLLFGITSLTIGGAERVLVDLSNKLSETHKITIFTIYPNGEFEKSLSPEIELKSLYNKQYKELNKIEKGNRIVKDFELAAIAKVLDVSESSLLENFRNSLSK